MCIYDIYNPLRQSGIREGYTDEERAGSHDLKEGIMIIVNLDVMMAKRKMSSGELAQRIGITQANLSILKNQKAKAVRFETLDAICRNLDCQPGDILEFREE